MDSITPADYEAMVTSLDPNNKRPVDARIQGFMEKPGIWPELSRRYLPEGWEATTKAEYIKLGTRYLDALGEATLGPEVPLLPAEMVINSIGDRQMVVVDAGDTAWVCAIDADRKRLVIQPLAGGAPELDIELSTLPDVRILEANPPFSTEDKPYIAPRALVGFADGEAGHLILVSNDHLYHFQLGEEGQPRHMKASGEVHFYRSNGKVRLAIQSEGRVGHIALDEFGDADAISWLSEPDREMVLAKVLAVPETLGGGFLLYNWNGNRHIAANGTASDLPMPPGFTQLQWCTLRQGETGPLLLTVGKVDAVERAHRLIDLARWLKGEDDCVVHTFDLPAIPECHDPFIPNRTPFGTLMGRAPAIRYGLLRPTGGKPIYVGPQENPPYATLQTAWIGRQPVLIHRPIGRQLVRRDLQLTIDPPPTDYTEVWKGIKNNWYFFALIALAYFAYRHRNLKPKVPA